MHARRHRRLGPSALIVLAALAGALPVPASSQDRPLRVAVGPFLPTPSDTRAAYEPFFRHIATALGERHELTVANDWAGIAIALANEQVDIAWMGPWGYVLSHHEGEARAVATVKYDGRPFYHAIIMARPGLDIARFPEDARGLRISFADVGSTSGWLIPHYWFKGQGIDPRRFFQYRDGASHAANIVSVANGQVDLATDFDRNRDGMIARGAVTAEATRIVWRSDPLPNDPLVVRRGFAAADETKLQAALLAIDEEKAKVVMPPRYTGWIAANHSSYSIIEDAGVAVGRLQPRTNAR
ncbi:MAG: phosphate/phosphite/phosphonate ABC transporter substrate-binding protein [Alphaproteobacteria bacterium]|nr:phosphate/phosphite/phosphonate ABC transporter substrate-binding protein [Alphaproteobacteria bacterium]